MSEIFSWAEGIIHILVPIAGIAVVIYDHSTTNLLLLLILIVLWGQFSLKKHG